jgi:hypothetical protein
MEYILTCRYTHNWHNNLHALILFPFSVSSSQFFLPYNFYNLTSFPFILFFIILYYIWCRYPSLSCWIPVVDESFKDSELNDRKQFLGSGLPSLLRKFILVTILVTLQLCHIFGWNFSSLYIGIYFNIVATRHEQILRSLWFMFYGSFLDKASE